MPYKDPEQARARKRRHREEGRCYNCTDPAVPGITDCAYHRLMHSMRGHPGRDAKRESKDLQKLREMQ